MKPLLSICSINRLSMNCAGLGVSAAVFRTATRGMTGSSSFEEGYGFRRSNLLRQTSQHIRPERIETWSFPVSRGDSAGFLWDGS